MENLNERRLKRLNEKLKGLTEKIQKPFKEIKDLDLLVKSINEIEKQIKDIEKEKKLKRVNKQHAERREILTDLYNLNGKLPLEDIRTNDGYFHATKVKKYPELVKFLEKHKYAKFTFENGVFNSSKIGRDTYRFRKYGLSGYGEPSFFVEFETLEECLKFNAILLKDMTFKQYKNFESKILKESERIKKEVEKSYEKIKSYNSYFLESEHLINVQRPRYNTYFSI